MNVVLGLRPAARRAALILVLCGCGSGASSPAGQGAFTLDLQASEGGTTSPPAGTLRLAPGTSLAVTAIPDDGWTFAGWSGAASGTANPVRLVVDRDQALVARFSRAAAERHTLTIAVSGSGLTSPPVGPHDYAAGARVHVTAIPNSGATFTGWSGAATGTANPVAVTLDADLELTAHFAGAAPAARR